MGRRPSDWSPVGWHTDPTPGDPDEVADLARRFRDTATAVETAARGLRRIDESRTYRGKGGDALRERSRDLAAKVDQLHTRYSEAAAALDGYHPQQYAAQAAADAALSRAREAQALHDAADRTLDSVPAPTPEAPSPADDLARSTAERERSHGIAQLEAARTAVQSAHDRQEEAGNRAANRLRDAIANDELNDSWKDDLAGVARVVADIAGFIGAVAGILALFLGWVPILGQVLAAVAVLATLVSLLANLTLTALGKQGPGKAIIDVLSLATFGLARAVSAAGKLSAVATRGRAWNHARTLVSGSGNSDSRYRAVVALLGGPLRGANRGLADAGMRGLARAGVRAASPRAVWDETVDALRQTRGAWQDRTGYVADVREAATRFSGGSWSGVPGGLLGSATPETRALLAIDDAAMRAPDVLSQAAATKGLSVSSAGLAAGGFLKDGTDFLGSLAGPEVDPPSVGVGSTPSAPPAGFQAPTSHIPPPPPAP